jgi:hypothetical protein
VSWTRAKLLKRLSETLKQDTVKLVPASFSPQDCSAEVVYEWNGKTLHAVLKLDHSQEGAVTCVLHELLHAHLDSELEPLLGAELAEFAIAGIEDGLLRGLRKRARAYEGWRKSIIRKVEGA